MLLLLCYCLDIQIIKENKLVLNGATIRSVTSSNGANDGSNSCFFGLRDGKIAVASVKMGNDVRDSNSNNSNLAIATKTSI